MVYAFGFIGRKILAPNDLQDATGGAAVQDEPARTRTADGQVLVDEQFALDCVEVDRPGDAEGDPVSGGRCLDRFAQRAFACVAGAIARVEKRVHDGGGGIDLDRADVTHDGAIPVAVPRARIPALVDGRAARAAPRVD